MSQICKICNKEFGHISNHITYYHIKRGDIQSLEDYYKLYIGVHVHYNCVICDKPTKFLGLLYGWSDTCSHKCAINTPEVRLKRNINSKKAILRKYGVDNISKIPGHADKVRNTNKKNHGTETWVNPDKAKRTNIKRYGMISYTGTDEYKVKYKKTCLDKYGTEHHTKSTEYKETIIRNNKEKYGVEWTLQDPGIRDKIEKTLTEKYGGYTFASDELMKKVRSTCKDKYDTEYPTRNFNIQEKIKRTRLSKYGTLDMFTLYSNTLGYNNINDIPEIKEKQKHNRLHTLLSKYNVTNIANVPEIRNKIRNINYEKYGTYEVFSSPIIQEKIKRTNISRYGVECTLQAPGLINSNTFAIKKYLDTNITYQSKLEYEFITACIKNNINITNGDIIPYMNTNNKSRNYYVDYKITYPNGDVRLIEIKAKHIWYYKDLSTGSLRLKVLSAIRYSKEHNYLPYKIIFDIKKFILELQ